MDRPKTAHLLAKSGLQNCQIKTLCIFACGPEKEKTTLAIFMALRSEPSTVLGAEQVAKFVQ